MQHFGPRTDFAECALIALVQELSIATRAQPALILPPLVRR